MSLGLPYYTVGERVIGESYFNSNGVGIAIIAVEGGADDWAAYIGADDGMSEAFCVEWTSRHGAKLGRDQAGRWFPQLPIGAYRD